MKNNSVDKKNFVWNFLGLTLNSFSSFFFLIIVNRLNSKAEAGIFTFSYSLICLLYFIGVYYSRTYQVSNHNNYSNKEYVTHRILTCILMLVVTIAYIFIMNYDENKSIIILLLCIYRLIEAFCDSLFGILQKNNELYKSGISLFLKGLIGVTLFLIIDVITHNLILSILFLIITNISILIIYDLPNTIKYISKEGKFINSIKLFKKAFPVFIFSFLSVYLVNSTKYTLDIYASVYIQNIYGIILMPGTILSLCGQYILNPYILNLSTLYSKKHLNEFSSLIMKISLYIVIVGILGVIVCSTFGISVLNIIYDIELFKYKEELIIIIVGATFYAILSVISNALTIMNKNSLQMYIYIMNSAISLILSIILIKKYSICGASVTYLITMFLQLSISYFIYKLCLKKESSGENEK